MLPRLWSLDLLSHVFCNWTSFSDCPSDGSLHCRLFAFNPLETCVNPWASRSHWFHDLVCIQWVKSLEKASFHSAKIASNTFDLPYRIDQSKYRMLNTCSVYKNGNHRGCGPMFNDRNKCWASYTSLLIQQTTTKASNSIVMIWHYRYKFVLLWACVLWYSI